MNDELLNVTKISTPRRPLDERLAHRPAVLARLHQLADTLEQSVGADCTADQAEGRVSEQVRQLAAALKVAFQAKDWAEVRRLDRSCSFLIDKVVHINKDESGDIKGALQELKKVYGVMLVLSRCELVSMTR